MNALQVELFSYLNSTVGFYLEFRCSTSKFSHIPFLCRLPQTSSLQSARSASCGFFIFKFFVALLVLNDLRRLTVGLQGASDCTRAARSRQLLTRVAHMQGLMEQALGQITKLLTLEWLVMDVERAVVRTHRLLTFASSLTCPQVSHPHTPDLHPGVLDI